MASQLSMVPVIIDSTKFSLTDLACLGDVRLHDEGIELDFVSRVNYDGDDETVIYNFWATVGSYVPLLTNEDVIRFDWDRYIKVKTRLP